ncbi:MAG: cadherin domain-containing protein [Lentimicrobium sp.]|jgi:hypothetical protein|nr:cadherin domain-containing protein [Lentimicrobium sp.]
MKREITKTQTSCRKLKSTLLTLAILIFSLASTAQTTYYIDPTFTGQTRNGSIDSPYSEWSQVNFSNGNTYLQKRGTTAYTTGNVSITGKENVTLGAYGTGELPKVIKTTSGGHVIDFTTVSNCTVRDLDVSATAGVISAVIIDGYGTNISPNNLIDNCVLHDTEWGVRIISNAPGNRVLNCTIYNIGDDGIYAKDISDLEIGYCNISHVNTKYFTNPDQSYSAGDNIQLVSINNLNFHIHNNTLDHSTTGNKFCFIAAGETYTGIIEDNTMIGNSGQTTSCIYLGNTNKTVTIRNNTLRDGNYAVYSYVSDLQFHYNKVLRNNMGISVMINRSLTALNNVFYDNNGISIGSGAGTTVTSKNNIFHISGSSSRVYVCNNTLFSDNNNFTGQQSSFLNGYSTLTSWQSASGNDVNSFVADPEFVNCAIDDYCLLAASPCINQAADVGLESDFFGTAVPQNSVPDIGIHERISEGSSNHAPVIANQSFSTAENRANGSIIGTVVASDPDAGQTLSYTLTAGNTNNAFAINANNGSLTVVNSQALNYETTPQFQLTVRVQDNGEGNLSASATITISLTDVNEAPQMSGINVQINENSPTGTMVGQMSATDPDNGQTITFSISSGNTGNAFTINPATGQISVASSEALNFEALQSIQLTISATDNGTPSTFTTAIAVINILNVNESPVMSDQDFESENNPETGAIIGTLYASDPDNGQTLSYSIVSGNTSSAFNLNSSSGLLSVANASAVNYQINPVFNLIVRATDNGNPSLNCTANVTVTVSDLNTPPQIAPQTFTVAENSGSGTQVGIVVATDNDPGQTLTFSITGGNSNNAFSLNTSTGRLSVANPAVLDFETTPEYLLTVKVQDNGPGSLSSSALVTVIISNVNESPSMSNQNFTVENYAEAGIIVGTLQGTDPDAGQTLSYSIVSGNTSSAFNLNASSGILSVANASAINYQINPVFNLIIRTTDNGNPSLNCTANATVIVSDLNNPPQIVAQSFTVAENSDSGTQVGFVVATDNDPGQTLTFSITGGNSNNAFSLNASTGRLSVANPAVLDFETTPEYLLTVKVQDNGPGSLSTSALVTVIISDVNESPSMSNHDFTIENYTEAGIIVGTIQGTDPDAGQTLNYEIVSGNTSSAFNLNASSGILSVANASAVNYQINPVFNLIVRATDNGNPSLNCTAEVTVTVSDLNNPPQIEPQSFTIAENSDSGTQVGVVVATDTDPGQTLTFSIFGGNENNAFAINTSSGVLTVANSLALNFETTPQFNLTIKVQDDGPGNFSSSALMTININDMNEVPEIATQAFQLNENSPSGTFVGQIEATDPDLEQTLSYEIASGNINTAFSINQTSGIIYVENSAVIDFETTPQFELTISVTDNGTPELSALSTIIVSLNDVNESPVINDQNFEIANNTSNGTIVGTLTAQDPDQGQTLTYSITSGNTLDAFSIEPATGIILVSNSDAINGLVNPVFELIVTVTDNGTPILSSNANINIYVSSVNHAPQIQPQVFTVEENSANGTFIGQLTFSDPDEGQTLTFSIPSGNSMAAYTVDENGVLRVNNVVGVNYERQATFQLTVKVEDNGVPALSGTARITVHVLDLNEKPEIAPDQLFTINEHMAAGTLFGIVEASDPDFNQSLSYSITNGNTQNAFAIEASTGMLSIAGFVCYELCSSYTLSVRITDNGNPVMSDEEQIIININDVNEVPTMVDQSFEVDSYALTGTIIGTILASDPDSDQTLTFSITNGNIDNAFALDSSTGELSVSNRDALVINPSFDLTVRVSDNGQPSLSAYALITITVIYTNNTPEIAEQSFEVPENSPLGFTVGQVVATDPNEGQELTYDIVSGNANQTFTLTQDGLILVNKPEDLNYATNPTFDMTVRVTDNGSPILSAEATININVISSNNPPVMDPQTYSYKENAPNGRYICRFVATDDPGDKVQFYLLEGNTNDAFWLQAYTGRLFVNNSEALDFETNPVFNLKIRAIDNHGAYTDLIVPILMIDVNEAPIVPDQTFITNRPANEGAAVGKVEATDPDTGQVLRYYIRQGNVDNIFSIDLMTGTITISNAIAFNKSSDKTYNLRIRVRDNGYGNLSTYANVTISVNKNQQSGETTTEFEEAGKIAEITAYPNPSSNGIFYVKCTEFSNESASLTILSLTGKVMIQDKIAGNSEKLIDLATMPNGMYFLNIIDGKNAYTKKLIKQ